MAENSTSVSNDYLTTVANAVIGPSITWITQLRNVATLKADTAGDYLLTNENLRFDNMDWTFFIAGGVVMVGIAVAYIVVKKRYWFW